MGKLFTKILKVNYNILFHSIMEGRRVLFIFLCLAPFSNGDRLLYDFLESKSIRYATIVNCDDDLSNMNLYKSIIHLKVSATVYSMHNCCGYVNDHLRTAFYLDADCEGWNDVMKKMSEKYLKCNYDWLIKTSNYSGVVQELRKIPLRIDSDVTVAALSSASYNLYEVYNSGFYNYGTFNSSRIGYWSEDSGVVSLTDQLKYTRRANLTGLLLKCMIVITNKLVNETYEDYIERPVLTQIDSMNRFNFALLLHVKDIYNFRFQMFRSSSWGYLHNGSWDGMVGALQRKQIDIGGSPIFYRLQRADVIDYTAQTWTSRPCFLFRHPKQIGAFYKIYTRPLDDKVWYCMLSLVALTTVALRCLMKYNERKRGTVGLDTSWSYTVLASLSALCQQGLSFDCSSTATRLTVFVSFLFALMMYQFYSASITSSLLMEPQQNIRSLADILHSPLKAGIEDIVYNIDYFARTTDPIDLELYSKKIVTNKGSNMFSPPEGLAMVKKGGFAFHVDVATAYKIIRDSFSEREICELVEIQLFPPQRCVAIVQKGSPYREIITYGLRKLAETGLMHRQRQIWHEAKPKCIKTPDSSIFSVTIHEFSTTLLILMSGVILSLVILTAEIAVHRWRSKRLKIAKWDKREIWEFKQ